MIGLESGVVRLVSYTPEWRRFFEEEEVRLREAVGRYLLDIQHVGSTAIPGMTAKPIVDIGIAVRDFDEARVCVAPMVGIGYEYKGENGIPRRHYFAKGNPRTLHVHLNEIESRDWKSLVLFRDYLIRNPAAARDYANLKKELAARYEKDREAYLEGKAEFIEGVLEKAGLGEGS